MFSVLICSVPNHHKLKCLNSVSTLCQVSGEACLNSSFMSNTSFQCFISVSVISCISLSGDTDSLKHTLLLMFLFPLPLLYFQFLLLSLVFWIILHLRSPWSSELFFILDLSTCLGKDCFYTIPFCFDRQPLTSSRSVRVPGFPQMLNTSSVHWSLVGLTFHMEKILA